MKPFQSEVLNTQELTSSVKHITFSVPDDFDFLPGQFVSLLLVHNGREIRRPYSIASFPRKGEIDICVKRIEHGPGSNLLCDLKKGDKIMFLGPMGRFILKSEEDSVFVSTGTGIGPFRSMIPPLLEKGKAVLLLAGYREKVLYDEEFLALARKYENFDYYSTLSKPNEGHNGNEGRVQKLLIHILDDFKGKIYICGLHDMIKEVAQELLRRGFLREQIVFERYD